MLALLAGLDVDSLESEFMQASVPHQLIYMNARMSCTHPGVVDYWMRWATRQAQEAELKESTMSASEAAALYTAGGAVDFPPFDEVDGKDMAVESDAGLETEKAKNARSLLDWHNSKGRPLAATDADFKAKQDKLFDEKHLSVSLPTPTSNLRGQMQTASNTEPNPAALEALASTSGSWMDVNITLVLDRMGHMVLAVKNAFDRYASGRSGSTISSALSGAESALLDSRTATSLFTRTRCTRGSTG